MAKFFPEAPPFPLDEEQRKFLDYVFRELNRVSVALFTEVYLNLEKKFVEPDRPQDGDISYADGTSWNPGSGAGIYAYLSGTWRKLNLSSTDDVTLDDLVADTVSANAIIFPATQVVSGNANALDDYEEGTWTPIYVATTGAFGAIVYDVQVGRYTKIGRQIYVFGDIRTDSITTGTAGGQAKIGGLPFASSGNSGGTIHLVSAWAVNSPWMCLISGTEFLLYHKSSITSNSLSTQAATDLVQGVAADSNRCSFSGIYTT